jgi:Big-like domain-containing protein
MVALIVMLSGVSGCTLNTDLSAPAGLAKFSGDQQSAPASTTLPTPLAVIVFTQFGETVPNVTVSWTITTGGGTLSAASTLTNDGGIASVSYTTGTTTGPATVRARVSGLPSLTFDITVT